MGAEDKCVRIMITKKEDFDRFFSKFVDDHNELKEKYRGYEFQFTLRFKTPNEVNENLLFDYYLIADKYSDYAGFTLKVELPFSSNNNDIYFRFCGYGHLQERRSDKTNRSKNILVFNDGKSKRFSKEELRGVVRLIPAMNININTLAILRQEITEEVWEKIKEEGPSGNDDLALDRLIYRLCRRLLLCDVGKGNKVLTSLRQEVFLSEDFLKLIDGIHVLTLLIFAMLDFSFRVDAVERYKSAIRETSGNKSVKLKKEDFLYELQYKQSRLNFEVSKKIAAENYDNKTIWNSYDTKKLHPFIIKEMYEAITISEGIIQLLENIVYHAGMTGEDGKGLLEMYVRNFEKDREAFQNNYPQYIKYCDDHKINSKYYLQLSIADLSGTDIPTKFMDNNREFIRRYEDIILERMKKLKSQDGETEEIYIPNTVSLRSFFKSDGIEKKLWTVFFSFPEKLIDHYGLQIFDSIISMKGGLFEVESGKSNYCNIYEIKNQHYFHGTKYHIICPFNNYSSIDTNIYDSMFGYDYNCKDDLGPAKWLDEELLQEPGTEKEKSKYIHEILSLLKGFSSLILIDTRSFSSVECLTKAILRHIFQCKEENADSRFRIAFLHCKTYQIIDIVRIIALFYNKQGENIKMENVQIYIRGEKVGEEILFFGEKLEDVKSNIAKSVCIRGVMFENLVAINKVLERSGGTKHEC